MMEFDVLFQFGMLSVDLQEYHRLIVVISFDYTYFLRDVLQAKSPSNYYSIFDYIEIDSTFESDLKTASYCKRGCW